MPPFLMAAVAFASMCALAAVWVVSEYADMERESVAAREAYVDNKKALLQTVTNEAVSYIEFSRAQTQSRVRETIRERVEEAHAIASHVLETFGSKHSQTELEEMVRESLRPIRYNDGRGYFFALDLKGKSQLFPHRPEAEGTSLFHVRGAKGEAIIRDTLDLVGRDGKGYYRHTWTKPGAPAEQFFDKVTYVKLFEPLGWVIGTGDLVVDMEDYIKAEVLARL